MATEKWIAGSGVGFTWTTCFVTANLTSLASASSVLSSSTAIANQTALDIFCDISISLATLTVAAPAYVGIYLYPLNQDGTSYGDNQFVAGTQAAKTPGANYFKGAISVPTGSNAPDGSLTGIIMPPGTFIFALQNNCGVAFSASTNAVSYRTYNRSVA